MGFSHLLDIEATLASFRARFAILNDVEVAYCHEDNIALERLPQVVFFPLMAILEGGVRFPEDLLLLRTLKFYGLCLDQLPPNFYRVASCVSRLNHLYRLQLDQHDINYMYSLCGNDRTGYYLKVKDTRVRLILCLPDSNRNSAGEFVRVSGNWHANKLTCSTSSRNVGRYRTHYLYFCYILRLIIIVDCTLINFYFAIMHTVKISCRTLTLYT